MESTKVTDSNEVENIPEEAVSFEKVDDISEGYHKFLAEMVFLGNLSEKIDEKKFPIFSKIGMLGDNFTQNANPSKNNPFFQEKDGLEKKFDQQEHAFFKSLAQNADRFGDFNIKAFIDAKNQQWTNRLSSEMKNYELDIDFGTYNFQRKFYSKYILMNSPKVQNELEKSEKVKIKMVISDQNILYLTRSRMDTLLSEFKRIYQSFCKLKGFLTIQCIQKFDSIFEFSDYALMQELILESFELKETEASFEIRWKKQEISKYFKQNEEVLDQSFFKEMVSSYFSQNIYETFRTILELPDLSNDKILAFIMRENHCFFEYMLKYEKQYQETEIQKAKAH